MWAEEAGLLWALLCGDGVPGCRVTESGFGPDSVRGNQDQERRPPRGEHLGSASGLCLCGWNGVCGSGLEGHCPLLRNGHMGLGPRCKPARTGKMR